MGTPAAACTPRMKLPPPVEIATGLSWSAIRVVVHRHYEVIFSGPSRFRRCARADAGQGRSGRGELLFSATDDDDAVALRVKLLGDGEADASGAASDQNRVTRRIHAAMPPNGELTGAQLSFASG